MLGKKTNSEVVTEQPQYSPSLCDVIEHTAWHIKYLNGCYEKNKTL